MGIKNILYIFKHFFNVEVKTALVLIKDSFNLSNASAKWCLRSTIFWNFVFMAANSCKMKANNSFLLNWSNFSSLKNCYHFQRLQHLLSLNPSLESCLVFQPLNQLQSLEDFDKLRTSPISRSQENFSY